MNITLAMEPTPMERTKTVGEVVARNYLMSDVFRKHGIDFCCQGQKTLTEVCKENALSLNDLELELRSIEEQGHRTHNFGSWQLDYLIDHIIHTHHYYSWTHLPVIKEYSLKVSRSHGDRYPQTVKINRLVRELAEEMEKHLNEEEQSLFPYIKALVWAQKEGQQMPEPPFETLQEAWNHIQSDHVYLGAIFKMMAVLTENFCPPEGSGATMKVLYDKLKDFYMDFLQHVHLENNILIPKALALHEMLVDKQKSRGRDRDLRW